ncbi:cystathionine beta-lyase [Pelagibacterium halotolerans]|uniref:Cystathionine beta-lyase n=1 Tax=Pelagibacterium halotolerans (strain DSM 22347 / JCM 15775 / CGMCC 1.7692 / B2) TaxID=1082931 RepID=G4R831_PELHB|nr:cystathionine beta-lyase [Pelagibacterium halotolerans]AEQ51309.1 cystathionine beta-lyase [Pelagibacterium halotolerans B2]QJR18837.1 cystathionine beta-lyase [Pelagibacterium halotolerans]SEA65926.1 cystathionine beta-lyase [Pelagibacterium halotolerans]
MSESEKTAVFQSGTETFLTHGGRDPSAQHGFVNTPAYRGSTVIFDTLAELDDATIRYRYGRQGTPLTDGLQAMITELEGAAGTVLTPSGVSAISLAFLTCLSVGDEVLITDSVYEPTRRFADSVLRRMGITTRYFDPRIGSAIAEMTSERTRAVFIESPGSLTFEIQDLPAITEALSGRDIAVLVDNSWATPLFYKPLSLGADMVIHSATKMFVGHSDAMMGTVSANDTYLDRLVQTHRTFGLIASPDDTYLATRGMRTLAVRMKEHQSRALELAHWLEDLDGVEVLHPALPSHPDNGVFLRDFSGAGCLFSIILPPAPRAAIAAMVDSMRVFGMGYSWGGFESLILPADPRRIRTAVPWDKPGNLMRIHVGFEGLDDLKADLGEGIARYLKTAGM